MITRPDRGLGDDGQILPIIEVAAGSSPALAVVDGDGTDRRPVEFGSPTSSFAATPAARAASTKRSRHFLGVGRAVYAHRTLFDPREHGRHVLPAPAGKLPAVIVEIAALDPKAGR